MDQKTKGLPFFFFFDGAGAALLDSLSAARLLPFCFFLSTRGLGFVPPVSPLANCAARSAVASATDFSNLFFADGVPAGGGHAGGAARAARRQGEEVEHGADDASRVGHEDARA